MSKLTDLETRLMNQIMAELKTIYDPEIPVNLVDLGLIYAVNLEGHSAQVSMTLTNPGCPVAATFPLMVKHHLMSIKELEDITINLVWDPPWTPDRMTEEAKLKLGIV